MNQTKILRYSLKKFIFLPSFFITNIILIASFVSTLVKANCYWDCENNSEHITITNNNVHIPENDISSLKRTKLWLMLDKQTGKQVYEQYKPEEVPSQFDYGDIYSFLAIIFRLSCFQSDKGGYIIVVGFQKIKLLVIVLIT